MSKDLLVLADEYAAATATFARSLALKDGTDSMSPIARDAGDKRAVLAEALAALDTAQQEPVNQVLLKALSALLTHSGMDEDEWSKPTFDQARAAIKLATTKTQECGMCGYVGTEADAVGQCPRCHWDELQLQKPAQQAQPERAPLSDDEIKELYIKAPGHCVGFARAIEAALLYQARKPERAPLSCTWTQEDDFDMPGVYHTSCGEMWSFTEGGIKENNTKFCPHCGGGIKQGGQHD